MSLLCLKHHQKLDEGWRLERLSDGRRVAHPPTHLGPLWGPAIHHPPPRPP
jgi:hypothetical protein